VFQIASISKQFAATAILLLQEQDRISVRDPIGTWLPRCPAEWRPITVHHLLTHTSGIAHWRDYEDLSLYEPERREDLIAIFQQQPLRFAPGSGWYYSSPAYVLVAHIVEQVSGVPYVTFLRERFFDPLGMESTGAGNVSPRPELQANGHHGETALPHFELDTVGVGAGDVWSTTGDLARWASAILADEALSRRSVEALFARYAAAPAEEANAPDVHYGYGWFVARERDQIVYCHPGDNAGFVAFHAMLPDAEAPITLTVLSNDEQSDAQGLGRELVRSLVAARSAS
jgi:CubicO group peptidase (beta-lactamase class C family)